MIPFFLTIQPLKVKLDVYDVNGSHISSVVNKVLTHGKYHFNPLKNVRRSSGSVYLVVMDINGKKTRSLLPAAGVTGNTRFTEVQDDGEQPGRLPVTYEILPKALRVFAPWQDAAAV